MRWTCVGFRAELIGCVAMVVCLPGTRVGAGLVTSVSPDALYVEASDQSTPSGPSDFSDADISMLPVSFSRTASVDGSSITAHYSFTDDGTTATLRIDVSFSLSAGGAREARAAEHAPPSPGITFSHPVSYTMQMGISATGQDVSENLGEGVAATLDGVSNPQFSKSITGDNPALVIPSVSGMLPGGGFFREEIEVTSPGTSDVSGSGFFQVSFSAMSQGNSGSGGLGGASVPLPQAAWASLTALPLLLLGKRLLPARVS